MTSSRFCRSSLRNLIAAAALTLLGFASARAETRVALVIGNGDYKNTTKLANPRNDATDVAAALKRLGFETIVGLDLDKTGMDDIEIRFTRAARDADMAMIYYSGHAIQYAGTNYLLPVDAQIRDAADLRRLARVDDMVADLQQAKNLRMLVLDSCRDNPLADELKRALGERSASVQRGLARLNTPQGMIVAYSTLAGQTANDGTGRNSPYTAAFLRQIETPQEISTIFKRVSQEVYEETDKRQIPELSLSLFGDFYLKGRAKAARLPNPPDPLGLVTDCDRLASSPLDPQRPRGVAGVVIVRIDTVPAPAACESAMAQYPEIARFVLQAGRIAEAQKDYTGARRLYEKAANMGSPVAMANLGLFYALAHGVPQDYAEAARWYEKAVDAGLDTANVLVGNLYAAGNGVAQDYGEARKRYEKAAAAGSPQAMTNLGTLYRDGKGITQDYGEARKWYEKSAAAGQADGMVGLAKLYEDGAGVAKDRDAARKWYRTAADAGNQSAKANIARMDAEDGKASAETNTKQPK